MAAVSFRLPTCACHDLVRAVLVSQLRSVALSRLKLDGHLLVAQQIGALVGSMEIRTSTCCRARMLTLVDDAKAALANLLSHLEVDAYNVVGCAWW